MKLEQCQMTTSEMVDGYARLFQDGSDEEFHQHVIRSNLSRFVSKFPNEKNMQYYIDKLYEILVDQSEYRNVGRIGVTDSVQHLPRSCSDVLIPSTLPHDNVPIAFIIIKANKLVHPLSQDRMYYLKLEMTDVDVMTIDYINDFGQL